MTAVEISTYSPDSAIDLSSASASDQRKRRVTMEIKSLEKDENGQARFPGCSNIREYEFLDKLGEGTFG